MSNPSIPTPDQQTQHRELTSGEVVDLHLHGVEVGWNHDGETTFHLPATDGAERRYLHLRLDELPADAVTVARRTPVEGEPRPGDVWSDVQGALWFAIERSGGICVTPALIVDDLGPRAWLALHSGERGPIRLEYRPNPKPTDADQWPGVRVDEAVPADTILVVPGRRPDETAEEYAARSAKIVGVSSGAF